MKTKLLIVIQHIRRGGVERAAINFAEHVDKREFDITFYLVNPYNFNDDELQNELTAKGIKVISRKRENKSYLQKYRDLSEVIKSGKYDAVHSHAMFFSGIVMLAANKCGVRKRISHSHGTKWNRRENLPFKLYKAMMRALINKYSTDLLSCSQEAGNYLYGEKEFKTRGRCIQNAIDTEKYAFNEMERKKTRESLGLSENDILVGHIGTIYKIKNQEFLVEIFAEMLKSNSDMKLILVGEEADSHSVREKAEKLGVCGKTEFLGQRSDVPQLLWAMDIMIFPSLHEALPLSLIEAQAATLPCLVSDTITSSVKFNDNVAFASLEDSARAWTAEAAKLLKQRREDISIQRLKEEYDIHKVCDVLSAVYKGGM